MGDTGPSEFPCCFWGFQRLHSKPQPARATPQGHTFLASCFLIPLLKGAHFLRLATILTTTLLLTSIPLLGIVPPAHAKTCLKERARSLFIFTGKMEEAEQVLGYRFLSSRIPLNPLRSKMKAALLTEIETSSDTLTRTELEQQMRRLTGAGLTLAQINALRRAGVLSNTLIEPVVPVTAKKVSVQSAKLARLDSKTFKEGEPVRNWRGKLVQEGRSYTYVVDQNDQIYVTSDTLKTGADRQLVLQNTGQDSAIPKTIFVKETGTLAYNPKTKSWAQKTVYSADLAQEEIDDIARTFRKKGIRIQNARRSRQNQAKVLRCTDIMNANKRGDAYFWDMVLWDNVTMAGTMVAFEAMGDHRLLNTERLPVVALDFGVENASLLISTPINKLTGSETLNALVPFGLRMTVAALLTEAQAETMKAVMGEEADERAERLRTFNRIYLSKYLLNHALDHMVMKNLPTYLFDKCMSGSILSVVLSPGAIRLYERTGSSVLYFGARKLITGE